jgi:hypothetical protein
MDSTSIGHAAAAAAAADGNAEIVVPQQNGGSTTQRKILFQHTLSSFLHDPSVRFSIVQRRRSMRIGLEIFISAFSRLHDRILRLRFEFFEARKVLYSGYFV